MNNIQQYTRRKMLTALGGFGIGTVCFQRALTAQVNSQSQVTGEMVKQAEWIAGIELTALERDDVAKQSNRMLRDLEKLRAISVPYHVPPAIHFQTIQSDDDPVSKSKNESNQALEKNAIVLNQTVQQSTLPLANSASANQRGTSPTIIPQHAGKNSSAKQPSSVQPANQSGQQTFNKPLFAQRILAQNQRPSSEEAIAFLPVTELAELIRTRQLTSVELTNLYLKRLKKFDPQLLCVVTLTEELAMKQARQADAEIKSGYYRGPLHGIPWGAKDLIAYPGYPTTWGATPYKEQVLPQKATVAKKLEEAGAVLIAKLSLGSLASGDEWFKGKTKNPWNLKQGASGSSSGSAAASVAGLVGFALGSETLGSIISPCVRCGASGLRPTFGRVSRAGCMSLAWSMDKIGPIARTIEDCALVFDAIHGRDAVDPTTVNRPFEWSSKKDLTSLKVGYVNDGLPLTTRTELATLKQLGVKLVPVELPNHYPVDALDFILNVEAATMFDDLTRRDVYEGLNHWPKQFHQARFVSAVDYLHAQRIRTLIMKEMERLFEKVDLYVGGNDLVLTNFTGHPTAVLPDGFKRKNNKSVPFGITFTGKLFGESELLAVANAYQKARGHHLKHPQL